MKLGTCMDCAFHKVIADPDPFDSFCSDDVAVVCTKTVNDGIKPDSPYMADKQEYKPVAISCRPYNKQKEAEIPDWCPLLK